jgi:hypothetical protein
MKKPQIIISIFLSIVFLILIIKNFQNLHKGYIVIFNKSGTVANFNSRGQLDGEMIKYVNGKIQIKANFIDGLKEGWVLKYYSDGRIENKLFYRANKAQGTEYEYYNNGKLNYTRYWKDDKQYGDLFKYFENGKLDTYSTYDILGLNFCDFHYDQSGKLVKMEGFVISFTIYSLNEKGDSTIVLNREVNNFSNRFTDIKDLYITVASPPGLILKATANINDRSFKDLKITNNTIKISDAFPAKDTYHIFITSHLVDKSNNVINGINFKTTIIKQ